MTLRCVLLLVAACAFAQQRGEFASTLRLVIRASRERFRPIQGARIEMHPGRSYWYEARVYLPGADYCRVLEHPAPQYSCRWEKPAAYRQVLDDVAAALGPEWTRRPTGKGVAFTGGESARGVTVQVLPAPPYVQVSIRR